MGSAKSDTNVILPAVFDESVGDPKFLVRLKQRAAKNFKWTHRKSLRDVMLVAYWHYTLDRIEEALEVSRFLAQAQFDGNLDRWIWIQSSLILQSRILKTQGLLQEANDCLNRVRSVGDNTYRFDGRVLRLRERDVNDALDLATRGLDRLSKLSEVAGRMMTVMEVFFLIEMDSSPTLPVELLEDKLTDNLKHLKSLAEKP